MPHLCERNAENAQIADPLGATSRAVSRDLIWWGWRLHLPNFAGGSLLSSVPKLPLTFPFHAHHRLAYACARATPT